MANVMIQKENRVFLEEMRAESNKMQIVINAIVVLWSLATNSAALKLKFLRDKDWNESSGKCTYKGKCVVVTGVTNF